MKKLSLYVLTYNQPKQFALWCDSFLQTYPSTFAQCSKYVVNNSDNPFVRESYVALFKKYGCTEIHHKQNLGINDGRYLAARHFQENENEYMVFFEDDMLLHGNDGARCESGFATYHENLFETSVAILEKEKLDYLKLNFTEVFGRNHDNYVWRIFDALRSNSTGAGAKQENGHAGKTRIKYTGTEGGLSYAVGNYYYCNWPILFTKNANTIFFTKQFAFNFEDLWIIMSYLLNDFEFLQSGCLFLSPVNHYRKYSYGDENRKENAAGGQMAKLLSLPR
jgi:hypothetical protein